MTTTVDMHVKQGEDFERIVQITDPIDNPIDPSDYSITGKIKKSYGSSSSYSFVCTFLGSPPDGTMSVSLSSAVTALLKVGNYVYDIFITDNTGKTISVLAGIVHVSGSATV